MAITDSRGITEVIVLSIFVGIATIFYLFRIWSRYLNKTRLQPTDFWLLLGLLCCYGLIGCTVWSDEGGSITKLTPAHAVQAAKSAIAGRMFWVFGCVGVRTSMTLLYKQIFTVPSFKIACYVNLALNFTYVIIMFLVTFLACRPLAYNWNHKIHGACHIDQTKFSTWQAVYNFLLDLFTIFMPLPVLWELQMPTGKKVKLTALFTAGIIIGALSLTRTVEISSGALTSHSNDVVSISILTCLEPTLGVVTACLPFMTPISNQISSSFRSMVNRSNRSRTDINNGTDASPNLSIGSAPSRKHPFQRIDDVEMNPLPGNKPSAESSLSGSGNDGSPWEHVTRTREVTVDSERGDYPADTTVYPHPMGRD